MTGGESDVLLFASNGKSVRFDEGTVRSMGRSATGVRGMRLAEDAEVVSLIVAAGDGDILTATARGYGKRTQLEEFPKKGRGTQGVKAIQCSDRNGNLVAATQVTETQELMLISDQGTLVRTRVSEVSQLSRNTQGVTLIKLPKDETLIGVVRLEAQEEIDETELVDGEIAADAPPVESGPTDEASGEGDTPDPTEPTDA
jgi:DNA gyrase subunit A